MDALFNAGLARDRLDDLLDSSSRECRYAVALEERSAGAIAEVDPQLLSESLGEEDQPILPALALANTDCPLDEIDVRHFHVDELADPEARLEENSDDEPVDATLAIGLLEDLAELLGRQDFGESLRPCPPVAEPERAAETLVDVPPSSGVRWAFR
jgi:hypothetical protein